MLTQIEETQIKEITSEVCETFVGVDLTPTNDATVRDCNYAWAQIAFEDNSQTQLSLAVGFQAAKHMASTMFMIPEDELEDADVLDAIGEITNILGGNIKKKSEVACSMSTPKVEIRKEVPNEVSSGKRPATEFCCAGHLILVHLCADA